VTHQPLAVLKEIETEHSTRIVLPDRLKKLYGGDFFIATAQTNRPRILVNFVQSIDGKISFNEAGHSGGGDVSGGDLHDRVIMGILRAISTIVFVGANTLTQEPEHLWTPAYICPEYADDLATLRHSLNLTDTYSTGFLTQSGRVPEEAAVFHDSQSKAIFFTTEEGAKSIPSSVRAVAQISTAPHSQFEHLSAEHMFAEYSAHTALCEGGPHVFSSFLEKEIVDELFITTSPKLIGTSPTQVRPSLVEGHSFTHTQHPQPILLSVRSNGSYLYSRYSIKS